MPGEVLVDEPVQPAVAVLPRRAGQCAYPMWGGGRPTHVYCSEAAINTGRGAPIYCEEHATRCFTRTCVIEAPTAVPGYNAWGNFGW